MSFTKRETVTETKVVTVSMDDALTALGVTGGPVTMGSDGVLHVGLPGEGVAFTQSDLTAALHILVPVNAVVKAVEIGMGDKALVATIVSVYSADYVSQ